jgi:hypothetical protein
MSDHPYADVGSILAMSQATNEEIVRVSARLAEAMNLLEKATTALAVSNAIATKRPVLGYNVCPWCEGEGVHATGCEYDALLRRIEEGT